MHIYTFILNDVILYIHTNLYMDNSNKYSYEKVKYELNIFFCVIYC